MKYVSVCAGIEAATVAWHPLGWQPILFAEIEPFPCAVLRHHYPNVPLIGDFTQMLPIEDGPASIPPPEADLLVGGTPCQAFSVAGKRLSLEDYRGNLSLAFADLFHAGEYRWAVWENVPGVLSTKDNAFGCLLGRLVGADTPLHPARGGRWTNAGVVSGPLATAAWRVLDAQYFGVAQRRRRVFVCVSRGAGNWAAAAALLPVGESVSGHPPTRRQAGEGTPGTFEIGPGGGKPSGVNATLDSKAKDGPRRNQQSTAIVGGWWDGKDTAQTLSTRSNDQRMPDRGNCGGDHDATVTSKWAKGSGGPAGAETGNLVVQGGGEWPARLAPTLNAAFAEKQGLEDQHINGGAGMFVLGAVPQVLRNREGKEGGGKGPLLSENQSLTLATANDQVVFAIQERAVSENPDNGPQGSGVRADGLAYTLEARHQVQAIAPSVTGGPPFSRTGNERVEAEALVVAAFDARNVTSKANRTRVENGLPSPTLHAGGMQVIQMRPRRLTPRECEILQGFSVDYTAIPWKKWKAPPKDAKLDEDLLKYYLRSGVLLTREDVLRVSPDGPRYKALGNAMAVPVMHWIGKRIQLLEDSR